MRLLTVLILISLSWPLYAQVQPFTAHYTVYAKGLALGKGRLSLSLQGNNSYQMTTEIKPHDIAAFLVQDHISEQATGVLNNAIPLPIHYDYKQQGGRKDRYRSLDFDWPARQVVSHHKGKHKTLALQTRMTDPLSLYLLVMHDLQQNHQAVEYQVINKGRLRTYQVSHHGNDILETPLGALQTIKISHSRAGSKRMTMFWFAPELNYVPVQVAQFKKNSEQLRLFIDKIEILPH